MKAVKLLALSGAASLLLTAGSAQALVLIDDFTATAQTVSAAQGLGASDTSAAASAIGGFRTLEVPAPTGNPVVGVGNVTLATVPALPGLSFSADADTSGSAAVTWDADGAGLRGVDLTEGGLSTFFILALGDPDPGATDLLIEITDTDGETALAAETITQEKSVLQRELRDFVNAAATNFRAVDSIRIEIQGEVGSTTTLGQIFTAAPCCIPLPGTGLLLGLGLGTTGFMVRRRN